MKKLLLLALSAMMMVGCEFDTLINSTKKNMDEKYRKDNEVFYVIDSCEYINRGVYGGEVLVHKGNCKFCAERRKQELKELVKQLKDK